jgi:hypothetical protein
VGHFIVVSNRFNPICLAVPRVPLVPAVPFVPRVLYFASFAFCFAYFAVKPDLHRKDRKGEDAKTAKEELSKIRRGISSKDAKAAGWIRPRWTA